MNELKFNPSRNEWTACEVYFDDEGEPSVWRRIPDTHRIVSVADLKLLMSFAPDEKPEDVPEGLNPMFYFTLTQDGDKSIAERLQRIRAIIDKEQS